MDLQPGAILSVVFPEHDPRGHEQEGIRPALVLAVPVHPRFPVLIVAPFTTDRGVPWGAAGGPLYPKFRHGLAGLTADSILLLDQVRSVDAGRVKRYLGTINAGQLSKVKRALVEVFEL